MGNLNLAFISLQCMWKVDFLNSFLRKKTGFRILHVHVLNNVWDVGFS